MTHYSVFESLPRVIPEQTVTVEDEEHTYQDTQNLYIPNKSPVLSVKEVSGVVDGSRYVFSKGNDYDVIDDDDDGELDTIEFDIGGQNPDDDSTFYVTYVSESVIGRYVGSHDEEAHDFTVNDINEVIESRQIRNASGDSLDQIGALFGELGRRRGRNDEAYRKLLRSIVQSFQGRGTVPGLKFAIAAGIGTTTDNVIITEDFVEVGYEIRVENVDSTILSNVINTMAELADPSGVELLSSPIIVLSGDSIVMDSTGATQISSTDGLGSNVLTLDGNSTLG